MDGILLIDKTSGPTSFDIVRKVRKKAHIRRVGHAGTLDPLASGLMVVCLGQGTKLVPYLMEGEKKYRVTVSLGKETDTLDSDGEVVRTAPVPAVDSERVSECAKRFVGTISQVPPVFSALKKGGEALYKKARRGETVVPEPRVVRIDRIEVLEASGDCFSLVVHCGKGTYIRSLARDMAVELGTVGHVTVLRRESSSGFNVENAHSMAELDRSEWDLSSHLVPLADALPGMPRLLLTEKEAVTVGYGQTLYPEDRISTDFALSGTNVALLDASNRLLAISQRLEDGGLKPVRGFPVSPV